MIGVRFQADALAQLDGWISHKADPTLSRPEAIRRLIEAGLKAEAAAKTKRAKL
jgi:hypothetical protein